MKMKSISIIFLSVLGAGLLILLSIESFEYIFQHNKVVYKEPISTGLEGSRLPTFTILLADSITKVNTGEIPNDKPVVMLYFIPECPYCKAQIETITKEIDLLKNIQFYVFTPYSYSEMKVFYRMSDLKRYPNIYVGVDHDLFFGKYFHINSVPFITIYGRDMRLKKAFVGNVSVEQIKEITES